MKKFESYLQVFVVTVVMGLCFAQHGLASSKVLGNFYRPDENFEQYWRFWGTPEPLGGSIHVFFRNEGKESVEVTDILLEGISLNEAIAESGQKRKSFVYVSNIHFSDLKKSDMDKLLKAGEPVWWKANPKVVGGGKTGEAIVRLRQTPELKTLSLGIKAGAEILNASVRVIANPPRIVALSFSKDLDKIYMYFKHDQGGKIAPGRILMDGRDVTQQCTIEKDVNVNVVPVTLALDKPLEVASFHCYEGVYADGSKAMAGLRSWSDDIWYGLCGARSGKASDVELAAKYFKDIYRHNINVQMPTLGSPGVREFLISSEGKSLCKRYGIRAMPNSPGKWDVTDPVAFYLVDEPDAGDYKVENLDWDKKVGSIAQGLWEYTEQYREQSPTTPHLVNVDMTFKPHNWYTYGQLPDILCADPYYQARLAKDNPKDPTIYRKATFISAVADICQSACSPKPPFFLLLSSGEHPASVPEIKRIEAMYALGSGAKGLGYWWFKGIEAPTERNVALWKEIGLLGAEIRTVGSVIVRSCPAKLPVSAPGQLWVRTLVAGTDTLLLLCVTDDYFCDDNGATVRPVAKAKVSVTCPSWMKPKSVFEVTCHGTRNIGWNDADGKVDLALGTVEVSKMVVITSDAAMKGRMQNLYEGSFQANVAFLLK